MDLLAIATTPVAAYLLVAALVAVDAMIPAVPAEVAVVSAGALAAGGHLDVGWLVVAVALGALAGDHAVFTIGRRNLPGLLGRFALGRRIHRAVDRTHDRLGGTSAAAIIAARFIPLGRTAGAGAAGLAGVSAARFGTYSLIGAVSWSVWMTGLGYVTGNVADVPFWGQVAIGVGVGLLVGVWAAAVRAMVRTRRRMSARATAAAHEAGTDSADDSRPRDRLPA